MTLTTLSLLVLAISRMVGYYTHSPQEHPDPKEIANHIRQHYDDKLLILVKDKYIATQKKWNSRVDD
jgi:hypothetical protein